MRKPICFEDVLSVYSGRPGCCCGCRGRHSYRSDPDVLKIASENQGYSVNPTHISDRTVRRFVNKLNQYPDDMVYHHVWKTKNCVNSFYSLYLPNKDSPERIWIVYMIQRKVESNARCKD